MAWPSIYVTRVALTLGLSANQVTLLSVVSSLAGAICFLAVDSWARWLGIGLTLWGYLLDLVDGEVARYRTGRDRLDPAGMFSDYVGHVLHHPTLFACWSIGVYRVTGEAVSLWLSPLLLLGALAAPLLAKQVILVDLLRRGALGSNSQVFAQVAIDKPGEQGLSDALGGEIVEKPGLRATLSQAFGYPGPLVILPLVTAIADVVRGGVGKAVLVGTQVVFATAYALNLPRTLRRNFHSLQEVGWLTKPPPKE